MNNSKKKFRLQFTPMLIRYLLKFAMRIAIFVGVFGMYLFNKPFLLELMTTPITSKVTILHLIWLVFMFTMLLHIFPIKKLSTALLKEKPEYYVPVENYDRKDLLEYVQGINIRAWMVMLVWLSMNAVWAILYLAGIFDTADMLMLTVFYYLSDYICILLFCPFQLFGMKSKCCIGCRIYDWGHFMMFTPMVFIKGFFSWSLFFTSCVVLLRWEISYAKHPERFWEGSNKTLQCANCKDKTCQIKRPLTNGLVGLWNKMRGGAK